jgi:glycosyltransferase involved in cell wall biosynthesis
MRAISFVRRQGVNILHSHRYKENLLAHLIGATAPVAFKVRTLHGLCEPLTGWKGLKRTIIQGVDEWVARVASDTVVAVSDDLMRVVERRFNPNRVVVIRNGIDTAGVVSSMTRQQAKARLGFAGRALVGFVGRLEPVKRVDLFVAMTAHLSRQADEVHFVIAGSGGLQDSLTTQTRELAISDRVHFLGHRDNIYDVMRALDLLVLCSDHEGLPITLLEALWLEVPVVARCVGGVAEVLQSGKHGACVDSANPVELSDACLRLLHCPDLGRSMCQSARLTIQSEFSSIHNAEAVSRLYTGLCVL